MITRMEISSSQPDAPALPLGGFMPNVDPVQIRGIDGLGPVKTAVASTPFATGRGELYQGSSTGKRNIVLNLGLNPNWVDQTMMSLRQLLYRYFMPEQWSRFRFFSDELPTVEINGTVESFEPNLFSQDPEIQVSILCPKPDFIDVDATFVDGSVDDHATETVIDYIGTVPTGFELRVESSSAVSSYFGNLSIGNTYAGTSQTFALLDATVDPTIFVDLSTLKTMRYVYNVLVADGQQVNILAKMVQNSDWVEFGPGENTFFVMGDIAGLGWRLGYFNRFGGL